MKEYVNLVAAPLEESILAILIKVSKTNKQVFHLIFTANSFGKTILAELSRARRASGTP